LCWTCEQESANKRRRKLITSDHAIAIASAIIEFLNLVKEIEKLKLQMMERITSQILESENEARRWFCNANYNW
jgi:hypothetical protein